MTIDKVACGCGRSFTRRGLARHKCDMKPVSFKCEFCHREFTTERRLIVHLCEPKRRYQQRDDRAVTLGFMAYEQFYRKSMGRQPSYDSFIASNLYGAFVRFGKHLIDLGAVNSVGFIDFLLRIEVPLDRWTDLPLYNTYVRELTKNEAVLDALERNVKLMQQWSSQTGEPWHEFFRKVEPPLAALWIANGRISPWILFTASTAHELMERMTLEQSNMVERTIDPEFWKLKIQRHQHEVDTIRSMLAEYGI